jgi:hypothetical protein
LSQISACRLIFPEPKVEEMARAWHGRVVLHLEAGQTIHRGSEIGRGGVWLKTTEEKCRKLR